MGNGAGCSEEGKVGGKTQGCLGRLGGGVRSWQGILVVSLIFIVIAFNAFAKVEIEQIAMDSGGFPFILDSNGEVWGFNKPFTLEQPVKIQNLKNITKIDAYIALDKKGNVYTWKSGKDTHIIDDGKFFPPDSLVEYYANYLPAHQVDGLSGITDIKPFYAIGGNRIYQWSDLASSEKSINSKVAVEVDKSFLPINSFSLGANTSFLLQNKYIVGWGPYQFRINAKNHLLLDKANPETPSKFTLPEKADKIYTFGTYTAALTQKGRVLFWGRCSKKGWQIINGVEYRIQDIKDIAFIGNNYDYLIFVKRDGTLWRGSLPEMNLDPNIESEECQRKFVKNQKIEQLKGMDVPAEAIAITENPPSQIRFLVLGIDKSLWAGYDNHIDNGIIFKKHNIELK